MLNEKQTKMVRHAIGLNNDNIAYRNYYAISPTDTEYAEWCVLLHKDLARISFGDRLDTFSVTRKCAEMVLGEGESLAHDWV